MNPLKLIWGPRDLGKGQTRYQTLSIKGVDFVERSSTASGANRLTSGTGTVELTVGKLMDEATGKVRVVPVHLRGVSGKEIKSTAFEE